MAKERRKIIYEKGDRYNLYLSEYITDEAIEWLNRQENLNKAILQAINQAAIQDKQNSSLDNKPHNPSVENIDNSNIVKLLANLIHNIEILNNKNLQSQSSKETNQIIKTEENNMPTNKIKESKENLSENKSKDIKGTKESENEQQNKKNELNNISYDLGDENLFNIDNNMKSSNRLIENNEHNIKNNNDTREKVLSNTNNATKSKIRRKRLNNYNGKLTKGL